MRIFQAIALAFSIGFTTIAQAAPHEPPQGSELRRELLDLFRPLAAFDLGYPIEFRVLELAVDDDVAFARLMAQRPGGVAIDMTSTPLVEWRHQDPYEFDGPRFEVFYVRRDGQWQPVSYGLGSSDVWWSGYRCEFFGSLLQDWGC